MGRNVAERLKDGGIDAKKGTQVHVPIADIFVPGKGHPLYHPRFGDPVDRAMVDDIKERGIEKPIKVRDDGEKDGKRILLLVDGGRRTRNGLEAQRELGQVLYAPIEFFAGTDADVLLERIRANADPLKKPDKPSVLALTIQQMRALGPIDFRHVAAAMPKGVTAGDVEALTRWSNLTPKARERFDAGDFPLGLLAAVLDAPRDEQVEKGEKLLRDGIRTAKGATRARNKARDERDPWARRMSPKILARVAKHIDVENPIARDELQERAHWIAVGMRLAADPKSGIKAVPKPIADAIREARARGRKA